MSAMTFDSTGPAYTSSGDTGSIFGGSSTFERLQQRRSSKSKTPMILAGVLLAAGVGAYAASEMMDGPRQAEAPAAAVAATPTPAPVGGVSADAASVVSPEVAALDNTAAVALAPQAVQPPVSRSVARAPARAAQAPVPVVSAVAPAPATAPVLTLPPAPAEAAPAPDTVTTPPPINPDTGAAIP